MKCIFLACNFFSSSDFRSYLLSITDKKDGAIVSIRCHRKKHFWHILTKRYVSILGIKIQVLEWVILKEYCLPKHMREECKANGLTLTLSEWHDLRPHDCIIIEQPVSLPYQ